MRSSISDGKSWYRFRSFRKKRCRKKTGTGQAFLHLFSVIEDNNLIRYSSVKRAVSTWIGIFDDKNIDRISDKLLRLMGQKGR